MSRETPILGVIGTMVWDTIWRPGAGSPLQEWGGISYALAAADANPQAMRVRPFVKLGRDLAERGWHFLRELSVIETDETIRVVDHPNPRVELRYTEKTRRTEKLSGGVPAWTWSELTSGIDGCEALYINFITGSEMDLACAQQLRRQFAGPIYADLHSLLLATGPCGERYLEPLERWSEWLSCFDAVQVNQDELRMLSLYWGDPWKFAASIVGQATRLLYVTLGDGGAAYVVTPDALPFGRGRRRGVETRTTVRTGSLRPETVLEGDPTGCGDVWGITAFQALLAGRGVEDAMREANALASRNVTHRGTSGLSRHLRGEVGRV